MNILTLQVDNHDMIKLMHLVLIIDLHAHFHSDSALYPDSGFQSDSSLSQHGSDMVVTVVFILTVVYIPVHILIFVLLSLVPILLYE